MISSLSTKFIPRNALKTVLLTPVFTSVLGLAVVAQAHAAEAPTRTTGSQDQLNQLSDTQLTSLAADWSSLSEEQRSLLIQETQQRMQPQTAATVNVNPAGSASGNARTNAVPSGRTASSQSQQAPQQAARPTTQRRRYGRLIRKADGSVVRSVVQIETIKTRTVRAQEGDRRRAYGMGFEQRHDRKYPSTLTPVNGPTRVIPGNSLPSADQRATQQN